MKYIPKRKKKKDELKEPPVNEELQGGERPYVREPFRDEFGISSTDAYTETEKKLVRYLLAPIRNRFRGAITGFIGGAVPTYFISYRDVYSDMMLSGVAYNHEIVARVAITIAIMFGFVGGILGYFLGAEMENRL